MLKINCDMGEWDSPYVENVDYQLMPYIHQCNIACGGHAGSADVLYETMSLAIDNDILIGAHPGYDDRASFGRVFISYPSDELTDILYRQLSLAIDTASKLNTKLSHIKPHGALYHSCHKNELQRDVFFSAISDMSLGVPVMVLADSNLYNFCKKNNISVISEAYIDRSYNDDGSLISRSQYGAVITNVDQAVLQYKNLTKGVVFSADRKEINIRSESACIHGDNPFALQILKAIASDGQV